MLKKYFKYIILFLIFYLIWAIGLPQLFKVNIGNIENLIEKQSGYKINLIEPALNTWFPPHLKIKAKSVEVLNKNTSKALLIENPYLNIKVLPLLIGRCHIRMVEASNIESNFILAGNQLYLGDYLIDFAKQNNINVKVDRIKIEKYKISLFDKNSNMPAELIGQKLYYKETRNYIISSSENNLVLGNNTSNANFDIKIPKHRFIKGAKVNLNIDNLRIKSFENLIKLFLKDEILAVDGVINIKSDNSNLDAVFDNLRIITKDKGKIIIFPKKFVIDTDFLLKSNDLIIHSCKAYGGNIHSEVSGEIRKFTTLKPSCSNIQCL